MWLVLIRHGKTRGNLEQRYIGVTDEDLCPQGRSQIEELRAEGCYPAVDKVFSSPMKRCVQTAGMIWPESRPVILEDFRETDFGEFENKNYKEMSGNAAYQAWIDSNGTLPFPGGEPQESFDARVQDAFRQMLKLCREQQITCAACVVHGGVIMSLMTAFSPNTGSRYDWQVKNGCGFAVEVESRDADLDTDFIVRLAHRIPD